MKILVTGSKGQLGNEIRILAEDYPDLDFMFTDIDELDITDIGKVEDFFSANQPDAVVNCAAYTAVDKAEADESTAFLLNATAVEYLAKSATKIGALLVHVSTDYVFDGTQENGYSENGIYNPINSY